MTGQMKCMYHTYLRTIARKECRNDCYRNKEERYDGNPYEILMGDGTRAMSGPTVVKAVKEIYVNRTIMSL